MFTSFEELVEKKRLELVKSSEDQFESEGKALINHIEKTLNKLNYHVKDTILLKYEEAVNIDEWNAKLVEELRDVKQLLDGKI